MPNIKSAKKRVLVTEKKNLENRMVKSEVKTEIKKIDSLVAEGNVEAAKNQLPHAFKVIDKACTKGIIHKNNAANKKAKLSKRVNATPQEEAKAE